MDTPPVPKPRSTCVPQDIPDKRPVPLPRSKVTPSGDRISASDILKSISTVSKQITEDVAQKVSTSAKSANEKFEKTILDGSKFAKGTLEKTLTTSRAVRESVAKSVIEGTRTAGLKLRKSSKKPEIPDNYDTQRCASLPVVDVSLFDNIQFHSPMLEQKRYRNEGEVTQNNLAVLNLDNHNFDDLSLFSNNSDCNTDTVSNFSHDSQEYDSSLNLDNEQHTYDAPRTSRTNSLLSVTPEVPERRKERESSQGYMRRNSMYENWTLPHLAPKMNDDKYTRPSKSTIYEFDPLHTKTSTAQKYEGVSNELLLLESFLIGDTYGTIVTTETNEESVYDYGESDYFNPPTPPERSDSLFLLENSSKLVATSPEKDSNSNWYDGSELTAAEKVEEVQLSKPNVMKKFSNMFKLDNVLHKASKQNNETPKVDLVEKPAINSLPMPYYCGILNKVPSGAVEDLFKNSLSRYCVLSDKKIMCYTDPTNSILKESYTLESIYSLQIVLPLSSSTTGNSYCFELVVSTGVRSSPRKVLFSCASAPERRNWTQKIAENLISGFPSRYTSEFTRFGWCYLKEGVSGEWRGAWVMLVRRVLVYSTEPGAVCTVDLRKTRCVVTQSADDETKKICRSDGGDILLLDCPLAALYLHFPHERELKGWRCMVKLAAHNNGAKIHHQQLTKDDVPTIVDKCLSFIYAHGSLSEGIYRRAGSSSVLSELLARFRRDAWLVQLSPGDHSEHDVAGVLKRFFRDLPEPLLPQEVHHALIAAQQMNDKEARHEEYSRVVLSLPVVARNTARKLFAHLYFLHTMSHANKMSADNLASVWAPTIMPAPLTSNALQTAWSSKEVYVVRELIASYEAVWRPTEAERRREAAVRRVLARVLQGAAPAPAPAPRRAAGALRAWLCVRDKDTHYQIALTPNKTSGDVCVELCEKARTESHLLMLEEVICNESMRRIVHVDDIVLDVVLRWGYWDEEDRKDNYLIVRENTVLHEIQALRHSTNLCCGELRVANETTKAFKLHMFQLNNSKLCCFKDKGSLQIDEWNVKDHLWYWGHEPKRNPQSCWAITFIPKNNKPKRSKERPWFGCTVAGSVAEDQLKWASAIMFAEHANVLPEPRLIIT